MEMNSEIYQVLLNIDKLFSPKPHWLVLATADGFYLGHLAQPDQWLDTQRIVALSAGAVGHHERRTMEHDLGTLRYGLTFADNGFVITAFTGNDWVLSLMFKEANLAALISTLQVLPDAIDNLAQLESTKRR